MHNFTIFKEENPKTIFKKISQHKIPIPTENILLQCELIKKGRITKNKRFFLFFEDYCLYYKVIYKKKNSVKMKETII